MSPLDGTTFVIEMLLDNIGPEHLFNGIARCRLDEEAQEKAAQDTALFGTGVVFINDKGDVNHVPLNEVKITIDEEVNDD